MVIVLSQLDDRYFRGLEGQYRFDLAFRVHKAGSDDYLVRTHSAYRMKRSVNVELNLEAGEYVVLVKIDAERFDECMPAEDVVRKNAKTRREKLLRIGLAYDLAHGKAKVIETPEEKAAREAYEKKKKQKQREKLRKSIMEEREREYYVQLKRLEHRKKSAKRNKERQKAKREKKEAEAKKRVEEEEAEAKKRTKEQQENESRDKEAKLSQPSTPKDPEDQDAKDAREQGNVNKAHGPVEEGEADRDATTEEMGTKIEIPEPETSTDAGENTPASLSGESSAGTPRGDLKAATAGNNEEAPAASSNASIVAPTGKLGEAGAKHISETPEKTPKPEEEVSPGTSRSKDAAMEGKPEIQADNSTGVKGGQETGEKKPAQLPPDAENKIRRILGAVSGFKEELEAMLGGDELGEGQHSEEYDEPTRPHTPQPHLGHDRYNYHQASHQHHRNRAPSPHFYPQPNMQLRFSPGRDRGPLIADRRLPPGGYGTGDESDSDGVSVLDSVSDVTERELDYFMQDRARRQVDNVPPPRAPPPNDPYRYSDDDFERDPWNAVAVVGLRVYFKVAPEDKDKEVVKLRVIRPTLYDLDDDEEGKKDGGDEGKKGEEVKDVGETDEAKVLDLDDSAKDATIVV